MTLIKEKSLYDIAIEKNFKTLGELYTFIKGKTLRTIKPTVGSASGHNYPAKFECKGSNYTINTNIAHNVMIAYLLDGTSKGSGIYMTELALYNSTLVDLQNELEHKKEQYQKEITGLEEQVNMMKELGIEEYDEKLIKAVVFLDKFTTVKKSERLDAAKELLNLSI